MIRFVCLLSCVVCVLCLSPTSTQASNIYKNASAKELLRSLSESPKRIDAETDVIGIFELWDSLGGKTTMRYLEKASKVKGISQRVEERLRHLFALGYRRLGAVEEAEKSFEARGFVSDWLVIGPFDNEGGIGLTAIYPPEEHLNEPVRTDSPVPGKSDSVVWKIAPKESSNMGYTDLEPVFSPAVNVCAYAMTTLDSTKKGDAYLRVGTHGAHRVYWNGVEVMSSSVYLEQDPDRLVSRVKVHRGLNRLTVKVCTEQSFGLGIYARLTDRNSKPWPSNPVTDQVSSAITDIKKGNAGKSIPQPLELLYERAQSGSKDVRALVAAAKYGLKTSSLDSSTNRARDFARSACMLDSTPKNCILWSELALDLNEQREAVSRALASKPDSTSALLLLAKLEMNGLNPAQALPLLDIISRVDPKNTEAEIVRIELLAKQGFLGTALGRAMSLQGKKPESPEITRLAARLAIESGRAKQSLELTRRLMDQRFDHLEGHETLARAALARGDKTSLLHHLGALKRLWPSDSSVHLLTAQLLEGSGDLKGAAQALELRTAISPLNSDTWKDLGLFLTRNSKTERGINAFRRALKINPQDAWLSDYLAFLKPTAPYEEPFIIAPDTFLAKRRGTFSNAHAHYLVDQTVVQVYDSGLSSTFKQVVVEINTREAAKAWRRYPIQFSPSSERVKVLAARVFRKDGTIGESVARGTIPLSEPWYRLYYDVEAEILEMPPLNPGDVLELRFRVEDTSFRNEFGNYFGNFVFIEGEIEKDLWRYVLLAPSDRTFYFNDSMLEGVDKKTETLGDTTVRTFEAKGVDRIVQEYAMPGPSSTSAYLHVSTYRSWQELGDWYKGLIRHQLIPDAKIRDKVKELVAGKKTIRAKVGAIHDFVVTATRYVGLEFGIHGYKPYPVPVIVSRGFGDCKDKASLLVSMLTEAGIEAEFILIRTRDLGHIEKTPASLAVFNHAIAYVPALDMWLDGTAEHFGIDEVPFGDQDASVLRIRKNDALFTRTPVTLPKQNASKATVEVLLDPDGDANLKVDANASGYLAALLRRNLEVVQTRNERFEAELARAFPGGRLGDFKVSNLEDSTIPVTYSYSAFVPRFAKSEEGRIEIPADIGLDLTSSFGRMQQRIHDIVVGPAYSSDRSVSIEIPTGYRVALLPSTAIIETPFGNLKYETIESGGRVEISRSFELSVHRVTTSDYGAFLEFCKQVDEVLAGRIVLEEAK